MGKLIDSIERAMGIERSVCSLEEGMTKFNFKSDIIPEEVKNILKNPSEYPYYGSPYISEVNLEKPGEIRGIIAIQCRDNADEEFKTKHYDFFGRRYN